LALALIVGGGGVVTAHHSRPGLDPSDPPIVLKGTVAEYRWRNPHILFFWDVKDESGKVVRWVGEFGSIASSIASGRSDRDGHSVAGRDAGRDPQEDSPRQWDRGCRRGGLKMRNSVSVSILALVTWLAGASSVTAQTATSTEPSGWLPCPRCQNAQARAAARKKYDVDGHPFNPRDISGVWGNDGIELNIVVPPLTARGKEMYDATRAEQTASGFSISNSKDGMLMCDPLGYPRLFTYNYGFEFVMLPNRVVQFFELYHTWRDIWTDGRALPEDPPQPRWLGYAVGRWEGDTFVIESNGYDERSWLQEDRRDRRWGFPHSDKLRVLERYRRTSFGTLEAEMTIVDPDVYTQPWTTKGTIALSPGTEIWENYCVTSESLQFNNDHLRPEVGASPN
jgi:hypothetical protein